MIVEYVDVADPGEEQHAVEMPLELLKARGAEIDAGDAELVAELARQHVEADGDDAGDKKPRTDVRDGAQDGVDGIAERQQPLHVSVFPVRDESDVLTSASAGHGRG